MVCVALVCLASLGRPARVAAQSSASSPTAFVSAGFLGDIRRYDSGSGGPQVYDGNASGGYFGAGAFITHRFSAEFELGTSGDVTTTQSVPVLFAGTTTNFVTTYTTKLRTYSALFAVHTAPSSRLHLSFRGGITVVHHTRTIVPPQILPVSPDPNATPTTTTIEENVTGPTAGADADILIAPHFAVVAALRIHRFTLTNDLSAFSITPMLGGRVTF
jgi:hypothetical protein